MTVATEKRKLYLSTLSEMRGIDEDNRQATFVAATERGVDTWRGPEVLRMSGARLGRFRKNPVFVDSHRSGDAGAVIGSVKISVDKAKRLLIAVVTYATTPRAEELWTLVKEKHLRAVSVGFIPNHEKTLRLQEGQTHGNGESLVEGPAVVIREWELIELSQVAVPADEDALRRAFHEEGAMSTESKGAAAPTGDAKVTNITEIPEELAARSAKAKQCSRESFRGEVMAICPEGLRGFAQGMILEHPELDLEGARKLLLEEWALQNKPVGTPEAPKDKTTTTGGSRAAGEDENTLAKVSNDVLLSGLKRAVGAV